MPVEFYPGLSDGFESEIIPGYGTVQPNNNPIGGNGIKPSTRSESAVQPTPADDSITQRYLYSFSGADAVSYTWFPQMKDLVRKLDTLHTVSISVYEPKGDVRRLGHRGVAGHTKSIRTIAGSMILTVINDHPLASLLDQYQTFVINGGIPNSWSADREKMGIGSMHDEYTLANILPTLLPPFDLGIQYVSEAANGRTGTVNGRSVFIPEGAGILIKGIEFISDGLVTSVNDIVSEMTLSFKATDYKPMARFDLESVLAADNADVLISQQLELQRRLRG